MGNRAVITTNQRRMCDMNSIYLHWNGGRDSIEAFLQYAKLRGLKNPNNEETMQELYRIIKNFLGNSCIYDKYSRLDTDNYDNGVYVINSDFEIIDRLFFDGIEQDTYDIVEMMLAINEAQGVDVEKIQHFRMHNRLERSE